MLLLWRGAILIENSKTRPGLQNSPKGSENRGQQPSTRVSKKASISDPILKLFWPILEAPERVKMAAKIASKTLQDHFDPLALFERFWSACSLAFSTPRRFIFEDLRQRQRAERAFSPTPCCPVWNACGYGLAPKRVVGGVGGAIVNTISPNVT